jgi:hypothetical protein
VAAGGGGADTATSAFLQSLLQQSTGGNGIPQVAIPQNVLLEQLALLQAANNRNSGTGGATSSPAEQVALPLLDKRPNTPVRETLLPPEGEEEVIDIDELDALFGGDGVGGNSLLEQGDSGAVPGGAQLTVDEEGNFVFEDDEDDEQEDSLDRLFAADGDKSQLAAAGQEDDLLGEEQ